jgi:hypothetical protein
VPTFTTAAVATSNNKGQTFTPQLAGLDAVELRMSDSLNDATGGTFLVNIRQTDLFGAIVGTSLSTALPDGFASGVFIGDIVHFEFSSSVSLAPLTVYAIELVQTAGTSFSIKGRFDDPYAGGSFLQGTTVQSESDLWFREGLHVPEPSTCVLAGTGFWALLLRARRRRKSHIGSALGRRAIPISSA